MNENNNNKTASMLQRVPKILAVTANSYGLDLKADEERQHAKAGGHGKPGRRGRESSAGRKATAQR